MSIILQKKFFLNKKGDRLKAKFSLQTLVTTWSQSNWKKAHGY